MPAPGNLVCGGVTRRRDQLWPSSLVELYAYRAKATHAHGDRKTSVVAANRRGTPGEEAGTATVWGRFLWWDLGNHEVLERLLDMLVA
jgi:hypothetical protein